MALRAETQVQPRMTFNYRILVDGLEAALCSKVQLPTEETAEAEHSSGGATRNTKHPGKKKIEDLVLEKAMPHEEGDRWAYDWLNEARDNFGGGAPLAARRVVTVEHLADNGDKVIDSWTYVEAWVKKVEYSANDALQEAERMIETVTISVGRVRRAPDSE